MSVMDQRIKLSPASDCLTYSQSGVTRRLTSHDEARSTLFEVLQCQAKGER